LRAARLAVLPLRTPLAQSAPMGKFIIGIIVGIIIVLFLLVQCMQAVV
jgi:hypothetical protein